MIDPKLLDEIEALIQDVADEYDPGKEPWNPPTSPLSDRARMILARIQGAKKAARP